MRPRISDTRTARYVCRTWWRHADLVLPLDWRWLQPARAAKPIVAVKEHGRADLIAWLGATAAVLGGVDVGQALRLRALVRESVGLSGAEAVGGREHHRAR
jgi:hypothetical protein